MEISTFGRAISLCSRCNNPHVYHVNVAFTLKIYQISGLTNTFCAHKYFSYLFTKFDGEQICFSDVVLSLEIISEGWRTLAVGAHFDIIAIVFLYHHYCFLILSLSFLISSLSFCKTHYKPLRIWTSHLSGISLYFGVNYVIMKYALMCYLTLYDPGGGGGGRSNPIVFNQGKKHTFQTAISCELSDWDT